MDQETIAGFLGLFGELLAPDAGTTDPAEARLRDSERLEDLIHLIIQTTKNPAFKDQLSSLDSEIQEVFEAIAAVAPDPETLEVTESMEGIVALTSIIDAIAEARLSATPPVAPEPPPARHEVEEYTQHFVNQAIQRYESEGLDATVAHYNTRESIDGQWYVFIFDQDDIMLAHAPNPDLVDKPASYATGPNGYPVGEAVVAAADDDGEWFSYTYPNPATGGLETKHSWMVKRDGLTFGSGWYEPGPRRSENPVYTQAFVQQAINLYNAVGLEETVSFYNTPESIDGQWYVFIFDQDDVMLAHAPNPDLVDKPASYATGSNGYPVGEAVVAAADEDGEWFSYTYPNPATGGLETKHSWMIERDGLTFGSGWYEPGPSRSENPAYTQAFVQQAINLYNAVGLEETVTYYNTPESIDGQWYIFIYDIDDDSLLTHAAIPDLIGKPASAAVGPSNYPAGEAVFAVADEDGEWFSYSYTNPDTGATERKHSWMVVYDGLVFGSGWYEPGPRKSDNPAYTKDFVERAIGLYEAVGRDVTVAYYKTKESVDGQWYVFIVDGEGYTISHHNEMFLGRDPALRVDSTGYFYGDDLLSATESGRWVDYVLLNPETGDERQKHTWAVRHDGLIFASGWYE